MSLIVLKAGVSVGLSVNGRRVGVFPMPKGIIFGSVDFSDFNGNYIISIRREFDKVILSKEMFFKIDIEQVVDGKRVNVLNNTYWVSSARYDIAPGLPRITYLYSAIVLDLAKSGRFIYSGSESIKESPKAINEQEVKLLEYIPIRSSWTRGFYVKKDDGKHYLVGLEEQSSSTEDKKRLFGILLPEGFDPMGAIDATAITKYCKFIVKDYVKSSRLFKFTDLKKSLVGKTLNGCEIEFDSKIKSTDEKFATVKLIIDEENDKKTRFLLSDLQIVYPNIKGFNPPKDRTLRVGVNAKISDNRKLQIPRNEQVKVVSIKKIGEKSYAVVNYNNKKVMVNSKSLKIC